MFLPDGTEPIEQGDVDLLAPAEVVVHEAPPASADFAMSSMETSS